MCKLNTIIHETAKTVVRNTYAFTLFLTSKFTTTALFLPENTTDR